MIATGGQDKLVKLWNRQLELVATLKGHRRGVWDVQFSPVDKVIATASGDKTVKVWSVTDYSCLKTFEGHTAPVLKVSFLNVGMQVTPRTLPFSAHKLCLFSLSYLLLSLSHWLDGRHGSRSLV